jgi:serine/threonine protein phosphatase PrpC
MPLPLQLIVRGAWITNRGKVRSNNEDACLAGQTHSQVCQEQAVGFELSKGTPWTLAVADGIGGHNAGEQASQRLIASLALHRECSTAGITQLLHDLNMEFCTLGRMNPTLAGMGAAVAGLCLGPDGLFAFNVGDARVYRQQDSALTQITRDDSLAQVLEDAGQLEPDSVRGKGLHVLMQSIGGRYSHQTIDPHIHTLSVGSASRFMLCTDGLTDMVPVEIMEKILSQTKVALAATNQLFAAAIAAGGRDNVTIIVADLEVV